MKDRIWSPEKRISFGEHWLPSSSTRWFHSRVGYRISSVDLGRSRNFAGASSGDGGSRLQRRVWSLEMWWSGAPNRWWVSPSYVVSLKYRWWGCLSYLNSPKINLGFIRAAPIYIIEIRTSLWPCLRAILKPKSIATSLRIWEISKRLWRVYPFAQQQARIYSTIILLGTTVT